jgi:hypothetical protein
MLTPRNANQFTIVQLMTATREWQGLTPSEPIVREEVLQLGPEGQLVGILSRPAVRRPSGSGAAPGAFIILNAGVLHRVGPHRLHVLLARRVAAAGMPGLRLDLGGIGDSVASSDATSFRDSAVADTRLAMTGLAGALAGDAEIRRFVLFGVCSGADNSIATALADDRVAAIVLVDPATYANRRSKLRYLRARVAERSSPRDAIRWGLTVARRRLRDTLARLGDRSDDPPPEGREPPPISTFRAQLTQLVDRGVRILAVYSGIHGAGYNHADQLFELFPELRGRIDHMYFPGANHTFTELASQGELLDAVTRWITKLG